MRGALVDRCDQCSAFLRPMTAEQHAAVEMVYQELAAQLDWPIGSGIKRTPWEWHQLMLGAFAEDHGWQPVYLPSLNGGGFTMVVRTKQSRLTKRQGSDLIDFAKAWALGRGVVLHEPEPRALEPEHRQAA